MRLKDETEEYKTVKSDNCVECGNPWFLKLDDKFLECTTCGYLHEVKEKKKESEK